MKVCRKCKLEKSEIYFSKDRSRKDGLQVYCKDCTKIYNKIYRNLNKEEIIVNRKKYYQNNKEKVKNKSNKYYKENKEKRRVYNEENKEKIKSYRSGYRVKNKDKINENRKKRMDSNSLYRLRVNLGNRTHQAFIRKSYKKESKTGVMLGCDWAFLKGYIERKFTDGMTWDNYGEWHIDHIYPLSKARDEEHLTHLCHYTNLQPLWSDENLKKRDSISDNIQIKLI